MKRFGLWLVLGVGVGAACGSGSALFLFLLDRATAFRTAHPALVYALPLAGLLLGAVSARLGAKVRGGNNLVIDTLHDGGPEIPLRMAPLVLAGTVATHFFGGSAGREGTAVQMGASLTDWLSHRLRVPPDLRRQLLAAGVAGGFGSVFGTPVAGTLFGLEFVALGRMEHAALVPALVAALTGDLVTKAFGIVHMPYPELAPLELTPGLALKWGLFAAAIAITAILFIELTHALKQLPPARPEWKMAMGGCCVVALWQLVGTEDYLGLGAPTILRAFSDETLLPSAFALKLLFTAVTLGAGFLGGEVTPLFFMGATLGNVLARALQLPVSVGAGVGMVSLFAAAANTPLALCLMAVELFGSAVLPHALLVCVLAYLLTGARSIYPSQRGLDGKWPQRR